MASFFVNFHTPPSVYWAMTAEERDAVIRYANAQAKKR